jgi:hypothetical protein
MAKYKPLTAADLRDDVDRLARLLNDPQEGLFTWNAMTAEACERLAVKLRGAGFGVKRRSGTTRNPGTNEAR